MTPATSPTTSAGPGGHRLGRRVDRGIVRLEELRSGAWTLRGTAKIVGNVAVGEGRVDGSLVVGGGLAADAFTARGTVEVIGPVEVRTTLSVDGALIARSTTHAQDADFRGASRLSGPLQVDRVLEVGGSLEVPEARVGELRLAGLASIHGTLQGLVVSATLDPGSVLGHVEARTARLVGRAPGPVARVLGIQRTVSVERVEAETVELERIDVGYVRGNEIILGPQSHVTTAIGRIVRRHPSSRLGPESRSAPPHGLRR